MGQKHAHSGGISAGAGSDQGAQTQGFVSLSAGQGREDTAEEGEATDEPLGGRRTHRC